MQSVNDIRRAFVDYFVKNGHEAVGSSPLVPQNDPTLMFTNAGMVQFKNLFTGVEQRGYTRAVTSQKCVRAGGKHNDLDNVGYTARHHTFFEMLGNFSFGDYFKADAIELAWNLITKEYGLPAEKLLATVYHEDDEAFGLWKKIAGLHDEKIIRIATSDNFWAMGDVGPCGPCSEIFYDHGPAVAGGPPGSPDEDGDRFIEIWNLVFMQFEQVDKETRIDLPKPSIDTGMGLERIAAVLQGKHDNYETDLFQRLIAQSVELTGTRAEGAAAPSHKVVADHLRAATFLIADGVMPANDGRGYVLRRIMRRGMRHGHLLGARDPLLYRMAPTLIAEMGHAFPEIQRAEALITETLKLEETNFRKTLERGLKLLGEALDDIEADAPLPGETAFKLYDTYGFPLDLTQDALRAQGRVVDLAGFDQAMARQKEEARKSWKGSGAAGVAPIWFQIKDRVGASEFLGYETTKAEGQVVALVGEGDRDVRRLEEGQKGALIANQTPFYGESGGQQGDHGVIRTAAAKLAVDDVTKLMGDLFVHHVRVLEGAVAVGEAAEFLADPERRRKLQRAHSATHLMHGALRDHLGAHVAQKGSLVAPDRLRFDFSHPKPMSAQELDAVERDVNHYLRQNAPTSTRLMPVEDAIASGAMALFGEKYGDEVRVVSMAERVDGSVYSRELCGGTHVGRTGDIALFKVVSEGAVASGVRRVEALTGEAALDLVRDKEAALEQAAATLKVPANDLPARVQALLDEKKKLEGDLANARQQLAAGGAQASAAQEIAGLSYVGRVLEGVPAKDLRTAADTIKKDMGAGVVALVSVNDGKASIVVSAAGDAPIDAVQLVRAGVAALGGKGGGGRKDFAQGGGPDGAAAQAAIDAVAAALKARAA